MTALLAKVRNYTNQVSLLGAFNPFAPDNSYFIAFRFNSPGCLRVPGNRVDSGGQFSVLDGRPSRVKKNMPAATTSRLNNNWVGEGRSTTRAPRYCTTMIV